MKPDTRIAAPRRTLRFWRGNPPATPAGSESLRGARQTLSFWRGTPAGQRIAARHPANATLLARRASGPSCGAQTAIGIAVAGPSRRHLDAPPAHDLLAGSGLDQMFIGVQALVRPWQPHGPEPAAPGSDWIWSLEEGRVMEVPGHAEP